MLKCFEEDKEMSKIQFLPEEKTLITIEKGRSVKFWEIPKIWRDHSTEAEEEKEIEIRRKVENLHRVREAVKKK